MTVRVAEIERLLGRMDQQIREMARVVAATADDTLRANILLEELALAGKLPPLPWRLATLLVEVHHAKLARDNKDSIVGEGSMDERIQALLAQISVLRQELHHGAEAPHQ